MSSDDVPSVENFTAILRNQGLTLDERRLLTVLETHVAFRPALNRMRGIELSYLDPVEPGHVFQWIEGGGTIPSAES